MRRYRILFVFFLLFCLGLWFFGNRNMGLYGAVALLVCLPGEVLAALAVRRSVTVAVSTAVSLAKNAAVPVRLTVHNMARCGAVRLRVSLCFCNLLTGERQKKTVWLSVGGRKKSDAMLTVGFPHCGKVEIAVTELAVFDAFGCVCLKKPLSEKTAVLVLPQIYSVQVSRCRPTWQDPESEAYSMLRAGNDPNETFALREYRPGDRIGRIHWKLSEKTDQLTVREYGFPVNNAVLILLDNLCSSGKRTAAKCEAIGEMAVSLSAALCEEEIPHDIGWYDAERAAVTLLPITNEEELSASLSRILSAQTTASCCSVVECLGERYDPAGFAHILVVTDSARTESVLDGTVLSYLEPPTESEEGVYVEV